MLLLLRRTDRGVYDDSFLLLFWWLLLLLVGGNISISCCCCWCCSCWWCCCCCWFCCCCCCCCFFLSIVPKVLASDPLPLLNDFQNFILTFYDLVFFLETLFSIFLVWFSQFCVLIWHQSFVWQNFIFWTIKYNYNNKILLKSYCCLMLTFSFGNLTENLFHVTWYLIFVPNFFLGIMKFLHLVTWLK